MPAAFNGLYCELWFHDDGSCSLRANDKSIGKVADFEAGTAGCRIVMEDGRRLAVRAGVLVEEGGRAVADNSSTLHRAVAAFLGVAEGPAGGADTQRVQLWVEDHAVSVYEDGTCRKVEAVRLAADGLSITKADSSGEAQESRDVAQAVAAYLGGASDLSFIH
jgi:hypothetical protein